MTVTATSAATGATATSSSSTSLSSLTSNFSDFLNLLMTQLQNQDPTSPMDTNQFTSQLVQYASVEQQINTNSNLSKLIEATQTSTMLQSSSMVGKQVEVTGDHFSLQGGSAEVKFSTSAAERVTVDVYSDSGLKIREATVNAAKWSGAKVVSLFAEVEPTEVSVFIRDRGRGFDPESVPDDRKGLAESVKARMTRRGGSATVKSVLGEGTEVGLTMRRSAEQREPSQAT